MMMNQLFRSPTAGRFGRRLKRERGARIPVTVLTGFLGAGKTTLLQKFLATPEGRGTAVVINEFGAAGIDDALVRPATDKTVLLGNGCLCCTTRSDLQVALRRLVVERERGEIPDFRRVVIETSGLADPSPILQTFATDRALGEEFHVEVVTTVVDACTALETLAWSAEARKQIILADILVVTKTDLTDAPAVSDLIAKLRALNPRAGIETATNGALDPRRLTEGGGMERTAMLAEADHSDGIGSFTLRWNDPVEWTAFAQAMDTLRSLRGRDLLRVKGLINVNGCGGPVVVQFVQHLAHPPAELAAWPDASRESRVVFITRNVPERQVRDLFSAVAALV